MQVKHSIGRQKRNAMSCISEREINYQSIFKKRRYLEVPCAVSGAFLQLELHFLPQKIFNLFEAFYN